MEDLSSKYFIPRESDKASTRFKRVRIMPSYSFPHYKDLTFSTFQKKRIFIHMDFDAFYAQVEQRDNPKLKGKPVSVGGTEDGKGIVMTASYEARKTGVKTGMSVYQAKQVCPDLISVPCYGPKYEVIVYNILTNLQTFVPEECLEQYSIDECFLDISGVVKNFKEAFFLACKIKEIIMELEGLTASLGVSYNKTYSN